MMNQAWPFLISRNQSVDYKTVVAPDFISQAKIRGLLVKVTEDNLAEDGEASIRWIQGSQAGDFTVVFRVSLAIKKDIGEIENDVLRDPFGREIYVIEGLVFRETPDELQERIKQIHLDLAHKELKEKYKEFWNESKISDSYAIDFRENVSSPVIQLKELEPFLVTGNRQLPAVVENRRRTSKSAQNTVSISTLLIAALVVLFFLGVIWRSFAENQMRTEQIQEIKNCSYVTEGVDITFDQNQQDGSKILQDLKKKHPGAWIFLEGTLEVNFPDEIKKELADKKNTSQKTGANMTNQKSDDENQRTIQLDGKKLKMTYHPLNAAITLLQNQSVANSKLEARVIKLAQPESRSQCQTPVS